ncbi:uncharacterized protein K489DRAFT_403958, partial [Dissoconium aciculare CBS 342.82]|uniref:Uncharacterized protein n=1 Tax=Dissoconium aciculare CBS 342.82 TaxID=1314786 RepID=A0A6J3LZ84_9PEZI
MLWGHRPPFLRIEPITVLERTIVERRRRLFNNSDLLREIWTRYAVVTCKRWSKKTITKRHQILRQAWGSDINLAGRPDVDAFRETCCSSDWTDKSAQRNAILWPHVNLEDLQKPRNLPLFLQSRALHHPGEFAGSDRSSILCDLRKTLVLQETEFPGYLMLMASAETRETYGKLIHLSKFSKTMQTATSGFYLPMHLGNILLEIQDKVWSFLVACARGIMHDMSEYGVFNSLPDPGVPTIANYGPSNSWSDDAAEAAYRVSTYIGFAKLERLMAAT